jgi:hypothetical protein
MLISEVTLLLIGIEGRAMLHQSCWDMVRFANNIVVSGLVFKRRGKQLRNALCNVLRVRSLQDRHPD